MKKIILGIDPGITKTGWALVESDNGKYKVLKTFTTTSPGAKASQRTRKSFPIPKLPDNDFDACFNRLNEHWCMFLNTLYYRENNISKCIYYIDKIYIESLQYFGLKSQNYNTAKKTACFIGMLTTKLNDKTDIIPRFINPSDWKKITGKATADKKQVMKWVETVTGYKPPNDHEADAVALSIYAMNRQ